MMSFVTPPGSTSQGVYFHTADIDFELGLPDDSLSWIVQAVMAEKKQIGQIDFVFCSDDYLWQLNREHLDHDTLTDIITFEYNDDPVEAEIYISIERVRENAAEFDTDFRRELHRVMIHGVLHCLGFSDKTPADRTEMRQREDHYLSLIS